MAFTCNYKDHELTMSEMADIHQFYEAACTAEYLMENYECVKSEEEALILGYEVRRTMDKYGLSEIEAIDYLRFKGVF